MMDSYFVHCSNSNSNCITIVSRLLAENVHKNKVPLGKYIVTKGLTKDPKDYPDAKSQPHVQVALAMREMVFGLYIDRFRVDMLTMILLSTCSGEEC